MGVSVLLRLTEALQKVMAGPLSKGRFAGEELSQLREISARGWAEDR